MFGTEIDECTVEVGSLLITIRDDIVYQYDFGDCCDHQLRLELTRESSDDALLPLLDGRPAGDTA